MMCLYSIRTIQNNDGQCHRSSMSLGKTSDASDVVSMFMIGFILVWMNATFDDQMFLRDLYEWIIIRMEDDGIENHVYHPIPSSITKW